MDKKLLSQARKSPSAHTASPPERLLPMGHHQPDLARVSLLNLRPDWGYRMTSWGPKILRRCFLLGRGLQKLWMLKRDPERFGSPRLGDEVLLRKRLILRKKEPSDHSLAEIGSCHLGLPPYAQDLVRLCSWERTDSEERNKNFAFSKLVGSHRGEMSLDLASGKALLV